jgi:DNA-binding LytR/AlgR family response regulator
MKVLIVEDEELSAERLRNLILGIDQTIVILGIIPSVFETIAYLENPSNIQPDLIFLDIHLEDDNGFKIIESLNLMIPIIFTTAFDAYMQKAFKTHSIDYLLKPVNPLELQASLSKFRKLDIAISAIQCASCFRWMHITSHHAERKIQGPFPLYSWLSGSLLSKRPISPISPLKKGLHFYDSSTEGI